MGERPLQDRSRERRIDGDRHRARLAHDRFDVDQRERRVARRLDEDERGVGAQGCRDLVDADEARFDAEETRGQQVVGAAVERAHGDDVAALRAGREENGGDRRHAAAESHRLLGPLEERETLLEARHGRIVQAAVDRRRRRGGPGGEGVERPGRLVEVGEGIGRGEVDRRGMHSEGGEGVAAGVCGKGVDRIA